MKYKKDYGTFTEPCIKDQDGTYIAMILNNGEDVGQLSKEDGEKALSLLVAAPELMEALTDCIYQMEQCEKMFRDDVEFMAALNDARSALNKVEEG